MYHYNSCPHLTLDFVSKIKMYAFLVTFWEESEI